jgi:hypothetical protein
MVIYTSKSHEVSTLILKISTIHILIYTGRAWSLISEEWGGTLFATVMNSVKITVYIVQNYQSQGVVAPFGPNKAPPVLI